MAGRGWMKMVGVAIVMASCLLAGGVEAAVSCGQVTEWLTPCISYAFYGGKVAAECCSGIKSLISASTTTEDRRNACTCIKNAVSAMPGINYDLVAKLPEKCGTTVPYTISPSTDCSK